MEVRPAAAPRAASNDGFGGNAWIQPIDPSKLISLAIVQLHISPNRVRLMLPRFVVANSSH